MWPANLKSVTDVFEWFWKDTSGVFNLFDGSTSKLCLSLDSVTSGYSVAFRNETAVLKSLKTSSTEVIYRKPKETIERVWKHYSVSKRPKKPPS